MTKREFDWLLNEKYGGKWNKKIVGDMKRVLKGEPIDYVIGFSEFLGCKIDLSYRPLVPRPETEFWTEKAIDEIKKESREKEIRCLDLFAGSGCIGIAILKNLKNVTVDFGESSKKFLKQIKKNLKLNGIESQRARLIKTNVFKDINGQYDYIFANPPYVPRVGKPTATHAVLIYEPHKAIFGGIDGLFYIRQLIVDGKKYLKNGGKMYIEFSPEQKQKIKRLLQLAKWKNYQFFKDQYNRWRYIKLNF